MADLILKGMLEIRVGAEIIRAPGEVRAQVALPKEITGADFEGYYETQTFTFDQVGEMAERVLEWIDSMPFALDEAERN